MSVSLSGHYFALFEGVKDVLLLNQTVSGIEDDQLYSFSFDLASLDEDFSLLEAVLTLDDGRSVTNQVILPQPLFVFTRYRRFETHFKLHRKSTAPVQLSLGFFVVNEYAALALDSVQLVAGAHVVGDPVFSGFHGQFFRVTGLPSRVFNLLSLESLQVNSRFVPLTDGQSISAAEMKTIRSLMEITGAATAVASATFVPPPTTAYNHPGTYLGSAGIKLAGHRLYVESGEYRLGFANVSLDGKELPVSDSVQVLADGSQLHRPSPFKLSITTEQLSFTLVNADHFLNIESAALLQSYANIKHTQHKHASGTGTAEDDDCVMSGLLGQTADPEWTVLKTDQFKQHLELDHLLTSDDLFGDDFTTNLFHA